jgi:hypothetical protein
VSPVQVIVELFAGDGLVVLAVTAPDGAGVVLDMAPDEARDLVNMLGEGIMAASRTSTEVLT